ncbi:MAG: hypothetical protein HZA29_01560 [Candidatus Omnitrophica bacterium]|nr:hypothetical protein [Candidatus Omnitrophota bacterium]
MNAAQGPLGQPAWVRTGKILDGQLLRQGGKVFIVPFKAGVNVTADDELDKIALMTVKGIAEAMKERGALFEILGPDRAREADWVVSGYVTGVGRPSRLSRWMFQKRRISLQVEGRVIQSSSQKNVAVFTDEARGDPRKKDHKQLGYDIGKDIGHFIVSGQEETVVRTD